MSDIINEWGFDNILAGVITAKTPVEYRLARKPDGSLILQGNFCSTIDDTLTCFWKEIPIVDISED